MIGAPALANFTKSLSGGGPPFPAGAANNGLSVDPISGKIVLGNDIPDTGTAKFLSNRFIDLAGFTFRMEDGPIGAGIAYEIGNSSIAIFDDATIAGVSMDIFAPGYAGIVIASDATAPGNPEPTLDFTPGGAGNSVRVRNSAGVLAVSELGSGDEYLQIDTTVAGGIVQYGDISSAGNNSLVTLTDSSQLLTFSSGNPVNGTFLSLDVANHIYQVGDISLAHNTSFIQVNDAVQTFRFNTATNSWLLLDVPNFTFSMGDLSGAGNTTVLAVDDTTGSFSMTSAIAGGTTTVQIGAGTFIRDINGAPETRISPNTGSLQIFTPGAPALVQVFNGAGSDGIAIDANTSQLYRLGGAGNIEVKFGLKVTGDAAALIHTGTTLNNGAGASVGTLTNAPAAGNPTKWVPFDDNGTTRFFPAW